MFGCFRIQVQKLTAPLIGHPLFGLLLYGLSLKEPMGFMLCAVKTCSEKGEYNSPQPPTGQGAKCIRPGVTSVMESIQLHGIDPVIPSCHFLRKEKATLFTHPNGLIGENPCSNAN